MRFRQFFESEVNRRDVIKTFATAPFSGSPLHSIIANLSQSTRPLNVDIVFGDEESRFMGLSWLKNQTESIYNMIRSLGVSSPRAGNLFPSEGLSLNGKGDPRRIAEFIQKNGNRVTDMTEEIRKHLDRDQNELERIRKMGPSRYEHDNFQRMSSYLTGNLKPELKSRDQKEAQWRDAIKFFERKISEYQDYLSTNPIFLKVRLSDDTFVEIFNKRLDRIGNQILHTVHDSIPVDNPTSLGRFAFDQINGGYLDPTEWLKLSPTEKEFIKEIRPEMAQDLEKWGNRILQQREEEAAVHARREEAKKKFEREKSRGIEKRRTVRSQRYPMAGMHQDYDDLNDPHDVSSFKNFIRSLK